MKLPTSRTTSSFSIRSSNGDSFTQDFGFDNLMLHNSSCSDSIALNDDLFALIKQQQSQINHMQKALIRQKQINKQLDDGIKYLKEAIDTQYQSLEHIITAFHALLNFLKAHNTRLSEVTRQMDLSK